MSNYILMLLLWALGTGLAAPDTIHALGWCLMGFAFLLKGEKQ